MKKKLRKIANIMLAAVMLVCAIPAIPAKAEEVVAYPYVIFAASDKEGAVAFNASNVCVNGSVATNGTIVANGNVNMNGAKVERAEENMLYVMDKIHCTYFAGKDVDVYEQDYFVKDNNININKPIAADNEVSLEGNVNFNSALKAWDTVTFKGQTFNANNAVIASQLGDIHINSDNVSVTGLLYAPYGDIVIDAINANLNNVIIIAQTVTINCSNANINYNNTVAKLIGEESGIESLEENDMLIALGLYNAENKTVDIQWHTDCQWAKAMIFQSDNNDEYSVVTTVTDESIYNYKITEEFNQRYFKVAVIMDNGKMTESSPFVVNKSESGYVTDFIDTDMDGLPDTFETAWGTDNKNADTDRDSLTDFQEVTITNTNPCVYDSVTKGVSDYDADSDMDGISNGCELVKGTNPVEEDSDSDELTDGEEVLQYNTNPIKEDTDEDGLTDGDEIVLGTDPCRKDTDGDGVLDDDEHFLQNISKEDGLFADINTQENAYDLSVSINATGNAKRMLSVEESGYSGAINNDAQVGTIVELSYAENFIAESCTLMYTVRDNYTHNTSNKYASYTDELVGIKRLQIFKYYEDLHMLWPVETKYDVDNNIVYCNADDLGTYCLMDLELWLEALGYEPETENVMTYALASASGGVDTTQINKTMYKSNYNGHTYGVYSGSTVLSWAEAKGVCEKLGGHLVSVNTKEEQDFIYNMISKSSVKKNLYWTGGYRTGYNMDKWMWCDGTEFTYTNWAVGEPNTQSSTEYHVHMYSNDGKWNDTLNYVEGDGFYSTVNCGFICEWENPKPQEYKVLLGLNWKTVTLKDKLSPYNSADTDSDGLIDWEELDSNSLLISYDNSGEPIFSTITEVNGYISVLPIPNVLYFMFPNLKEYVSKIQLVPFVSDPTKSDTDGDGLLDGKATYVERANSNGVMQKFKVAPKDSKPCKYNGSENLWETHISTMRYGNKLSTEYSDDYFSMPEMELKSLFISFSSLLNVVRNSEAIMYMLSKSGSYLCDFKYDKEHIALHSDMVQWQWLGGYNDFYDKMFDMATSMNVLKLDFKYNDKKYAIWAWKGNYLNLGAGSEVGFYQDANDSGQWWALETFPMTCSLYRLKATGSEYETYYNWYPSIAQWWITGFVPDIYDNSVKEHQLAQVASVKIGDKERFDALKEWLVDPEDIRKVILDEEDNTVWLAW